MAPIGELDGPRVHESFTLLNMRLSGRSSCLHPGDCRLSMSHRTCVTQTLEFCTDGDITIHAVVLSSASDTSQRVLPCLYDNEVAPGNTPSLSDTFTSVDECINLTSSIEEDKVTFNQNEV